MYRFRLAVQYTIYVQYIIAVKFTLAVPYCCIVQTCCRAKICLVPTFSKVQFSEIEDVGESLRKDWDDSI